MTTETPPPLRANGITKLKERLREFSKDLAAVSDEDELTGLLHSYRAVLQDCETKLPSWWNGDGGDIAGVKAVIETRRVAVRKPQ